MKSADEFQSFDDFVTYAAMYTLSDEMSSDESANIRWIKYSREGYRLEFAYSPISEGIMIATVNGKPRPDPVIEAGSLDASTLPLL